MKHILGVTALIILVTIIAWAALGAGFDSLVPIRASEESLYVDRLFGMHLYVIAFLFALIMGFMIYSVIVFRRKPGETGDGDYFHGHTTLEIIWTVLPLGTVLYFSVLGAGYLNEITAPEENELVVNVTGSQWNWRFDYPDTGISSAELNLPSDRQTVLQITSLDVIHSFWVPEFRLKQDAVPGRMNELRITPTEDGVYTVRCAEICGKDHAYMLATVNVMPQGEYDAWVESLTGPTEGELADVGRQVAEINGCFKCHSVDGSANDGPTWLGLYGEDVQLEGGTTTTADDEYIRNSILNPADQIVAGFTDVDMPVNFAAVLSDADIDALISFIQSLGSE